MAALRWVAEEMQTFLPMIQSLKSEKEVREACEEVVAAWRQRYPNGNSLRNPITQARRALRTLPLTKKLSYLTEKGEQEHVALKYFNLSEAEWIALNAQSEASLDERMTNQRFLHDPDALVARARQLLTSTAWPEVAVGITVCTGRRLGEVLKTAAFERKTAYSVLFEGQLKKEGAVSFEIPTLVEADLVIAAWRWLRAHHNCEQIDLDDISSRYGAPVRETADLHYKTLVETRTNHEVRYTHLFRTIYALIADYYYRPSWVVPLKFRAVIQGHTKKIDAEGEVRQNYLSSANYFDYVIVDGAEQEDRRHGLHLNQPGVEILEVFQRKEAKTIRREEAEPVDQAAEPARKKKHSLLNVPEEISRSVKGYQASMRKRTQAEVLAFLITFYEEHKDRDLPRTSRERPVTMDDLGMSREERGLVQQGMEIAESEDVEAFVREAAIIQARKRVAETARIQTLDFSAMSLKKLEKQKHPDATRERARRAVDAVMAYNASVEDVNLRWHINVNVVRQLVGGRPEIIKEYLGARAEDLEQHHRDYEILPRRNRPSELVKQEVLLEQGGDDEQEA
jgi:hypothetical protein